MQTEQTTLNISHINALVHGEPLKNIPQELYIPPNALEVYLESFEGPLDLLLYLIRKQNLNISEISIAKVTEQYIQYINVMDALKMELASKYLVMAALLAEIKSRYLLPAQTVDEEDEDDPTLKLIQQLEEYERIKKAAEELDELPRVDRDIFPVRAFVPEVEKQPLLPEIALTELLMAFASAIKRADYYEEHAIKRESLSVRERMTAILDGLLKDKFYGFETFFKGEEGRAGVITTFLALLELIKLRLLVVVQNDNYAQIYVQSNLSEEQSSATIEPLIGDEHESVGT